jgi:hypothetical protein
MAYTRTSGPTSVSYINSGGFGSPEKSFQEIGTVVLDAIALATILIPIARETIALPAAARAMSMAYSTSRLSYLSATSIRVAQYSRSILQTLGVSRRTIHLLSLTIGITTESIIARRALLMAISSALSKFSGKDVSISPIDITLKKSIKEIDEYSNGNLTLAKQIRETLSNVEKGVPLHIIEREIIDHVIDNIINKAPKVDYPTTPQPLRKPKKPLRKPKEYYA